MNKILVIFVTHKYIVEKSNFMTELFFVAGCTCIYQILSVNLTKTNLCILDFFFGLQQSSVFPGRESDSFQGISFLTQDLRSLSGKSQ